MAGGHRIEKGHAGGLRAWVVRADAADFRATRTPGLSQMPVRLRTLAFADMV